MFVEPLISKHWASLTRTIILISEVRGREARLHKWSLKKSQLLPDLGAGTLGWHPGWGLLFPSDDGGKRKKFVKFHPIWQTFSVFTVKDSI